MHHFFRDVVHVACRDDDNNNIHCSITYNIIYTLFAQTSPRNLKKKKEKKFVFILSHTVLNSNNNNMLGIVSRAHTSKRGRPSSRSTHTRFMINLQSNIGPPRVHYTDAAAVTPLHRAGCQIVIISRLLAFGNAGRTDGRDSL